MLLKQNSEVQQGHCPVGIRDIGKGFLFKVPLVIPSSLCSPAFPASPFCSFSVWAVTSSDGHKLSMRAELTCSDTEESQLESEGETHIQINPWHQNIAPKDAWFLKNHDYSVQLAKHLKPRDTCRQRQLQKVVEMDIFWLRIHLSAFDPCAYI